MAVARPVFMPPDEYLIRERTSPRKHEYRAGHVHMMAGANDRHNAIVSSANISLGSQLRKRPCVTYTQDMKVESPSGQFANPDVIVVCGDPVFRDDKRIEHFTRHADGSWRLDVFDDPAAVITLRAVDCTLALADVYEKVSFGR